MGSSSPTDSKDKKKIEYYNENGIIHNPEPKHISTIPIPLLLLSLIKIKEIKTFLQENQENIETNGKVKLLKILCDLNKSTKLINDYVNKFNEEFSLLKNFRQISYFFLQTETFLMDYLSFSLFYHTKFFRHLANIYIQKYLLDCSHLFHEH